MLSKPKEERKTPKKEKKERLKKKKKLIRIALIKQVEGLQVQIHIANSENWHPN